jgi:hypothetical protein
MSITKPAPQYYLGRTQKRVSLNTDSFQVPKEKLRRLESFLANVTTTHPRAVTRSQGSRPFLVINRHRIEQLFLEVQLAFEAAERAFADGS